MTAAPLSGEPDWSDLQARLARGYIAAGFIGGVTRVPVEQVTADQLSPARADEQAAEIRRAVGELSGKRVLEIGCGAGMLVVRGRVAHGLDIYGVEPSFGEYTASLDVARRLAAHYGLPDGVVTEASGEALPFPDAWFDVVYSSNVLEHVGDPQAVVDEAVRVLKPGGTLLLVVPNYGSWWEGHYGILWPPRLPAWAAKIYVRLLGRDPDYIDTLNLVDHGMMSGWLARHADRLEVLGWGWEMFEHRLTTLEFSEWASLAMVKRLARLVRRLGLLRPVLWLGKRLHWETPLILRARKIGGCGDAGR
jgi:SAM-dependent methyltransferase